MSKHTPGPWDIWETVHGYEICEPTKPSRHSHFASLGIGGFGWGEQKANAKLIAAAPDLLEVCKNVLIALEISDEYWSLQELLKDAIAKAES